MTPTPSAPSSPLTAPRRDRTFWRLAEDIPPQLTWKLMVISTITPLLLWWLLSASNWVSDKFLPSPIDVAEAMMTLWDRGFLIQDTQASIARVTLGFVLAAIVATPIGILRYMPAPAFVPLLIIYLGIDEAPKIALIFIGTVFFNTLMIMDAGKFVPKALIETAYTLGGSRWQILSQVIWPYIIPNVLDIFRVNMAASWNLVVVAELIAASEGLGKRIEMARKFLKTDEIFACLIILGLIGFVIDLSFRILIRKTCAWSID
jgi:NitT/TauT family transport system permease protein